MIWLMFFGFLKILKYREYILSLKNVQHVQDMHLNMIFTYILDKKSYGNYFGDDK